MVRERKLNNSEGSSSVVDEKVEEMVYSNE